MKEIVGYNYKTEWHILHILSDGTFIPIVGYNYKTECHILSDGTFIPKEMVEGVRRQQIREQNRDYWSSLPWYKKLFKRKPMFYEVKVPPKRD